MTSPRLESAAIPTPTAPIALRAARRGALLLGTLLAITAAGVHASAPVTSSSGLVYQSLKEGAGKSPTATDRVKVHYRGTLLDGKEFDSSHKRGQPAEFPLNRVIPCWTEGVQKMKPGGKAKLTCPAAIAYGERGAGNGLIPPNATLQFEVELIEVLN